MNNLEIIKSYSFELWNEKVISAIDKYFATDALIHSPWRTARGTNEMITTTQKWYTAFPDLKILWKDFICEDQKIVSLWQASGSHGGPFLVYPATNKRIDYSGVTIYHLYNGKIVEYWILPDLYTLVDQITH